MYDQNTKRSYQDKLLYQVPNKSLLIYLADIRHAVSLY